MFIATRIANGVVALLALLLSAMLLYAGSLAIAIQLALVPLLFLADVIFRKKVFSGHKIFTIIWTLFFSYALSVGGWMAFRGTFEIGGALIFSLVVATLYGVPFLLNSLYLYCLYSPKRKSE